MSEPDNTGLPDTTAIIEAFGGIRPMAHKLDVPVSTVQGWKQRNAIPPNRFADIEAAAAAHDIDLSGTTAPAAAGEEDAGAVAEAAQPPVHTDDQSPPASPPGQGASQTPGDRRSLAIAVAALIVAVAAVGWSLLGGERAAPAVDLTAITERLNALETAPKTGASDASLRQATDDIADLRAAVDRIAQTQTGSADATEDIGQLVARLRDAEARLDEIERQAAGEADRATAALAAAQDDIARLRSQLDAERADGSVSGQQVASAVGLALAAGRLQRAMERGGAYGDALAALRPLAAGDDELTEILDRLAARADTGVPTREVLVRAFPVMARAVVAAGDNAAGGWTDRTLQRIRNTVSIRRIGADVAGDAPDARVARAEAKLADGDLAGAAAELDGLQNGAAAAAQTWRADARARLDADAAVSRLEALAIERLQLDNGGS